MAYVHPAELVDFMIDRWPASGGVVWARSTLVELITTCFQASLMHEEGRLVRFRIIAAGREELSGRTLPEDWLCLALDRSKPFTPDTARRLSPGAPFRTSLMAAQPSPEGIQVWGLVHTGEDWLAPSWAGWTLERQPPMLPMIHVFGPGQLGVYAGHELVVALLRGQIQATTTDVFDSKWLPQLFQAAREEVRQQMAQEPGALAIDDGLVQLISQHLVRRAIVLIRSEGHGGLLLFGEPGWFGTSGSSRRVLKFRYQFEAEARGRYRALLRRLSQELSPRRGARLEAVDWQGFLHTGSAALAQIERSVFELSRLIANLSRVDGAVVLNKLFELIGFGAEVGGELLCPETVWQARDLEAEGRSPEPADIVGTRHRAAYRFLSAHPEGLAIVISHDGAVRFVANCQDQIVYWEQFLDW